MKRNWKRAIVLTLLIFSVIVAGCGGSEESSDDGERGYKVGLSLASATNPLYVAMERGINEKAAELGIEVQTVIAEGDVARQVNGVDDLIISQVDAILISPISIDGLVVSYERGNEAGIQMVSTARSIANEDLEAAFIGLDWWESGATIAEWMAEELGGEGKVAMLVGPEGAFHVTRMAEAFVDVMGQYPGIEIVAKHHSLDNRESGLRLGEDVLTANPDLDAIYSGNDELALGAVQAVESAGRLGDVVVTGFNAVPAAIEAVEEGRMAMTIALKPESWGRLAMETVYNVLEGKHEGYLVPIETLIVDYNNISDLSTEDLN